MNETDLNDDECHDDLKEHIESLEAEKELQKLLWSMLTIEEQIVMRAYHNQIHHNKTIHPKLFSAVNIIYERYPGFDMTCVP